MAIATPHYAEPTPVIGVTLELSRAEMDVLVHVLRRVGGDPDRSPRGTIQAILRSLYEALGVESEDRIRHEPMPGASSGHINFRNNDDDDNDTED